MSRPEHKQSVSAGAGAAGRAPAVLLLLTSRESPFQQYDLRLFERTLGAEALYFPGRRRLPAFWRDIWSALRRRPFGVVYIYFCPVTYAVPALLFARLLRRKVVLVMGGADSVSMPEYGFGSLQSPLIRVLHRFCTRYADLVTAFSELSRRCILANSPHARVVTVMPGVHAAAMRMMPGVTRNAVVTVNFSTDPVRYVQKGVAAFVASARALPDLRFRLLTRFSNPAARRLLDPVPPNLEIVTRFLTEAELCEFYNTARVYVQMSLHEGFGVAVAEAMLCGAVPVIARGIASEDIAGPCGFRATFGDVAGAVAAIRNAWDMPPEAWTAVREQALRVVNEARRNAQLLELIGDLIPKRGAGHDCPAGGSEGRAVAYASRSAEDRRARGHDGQAVDARGRSPNTTAHRSDLARRLGL